MIIRHKRFLDVCFQTLSGPTYGECLNYWGRWVNMGYVSSWYLPIQNQWIELRDESDWEKCTNWEDMACLRYGTWVPL